MPAAGPRVRDIQTRGCDGNTSGIVTPRDARFVASPTIPRGGGQPTFFPRPSPHIGPRPGRPGRSPRKQKPLVTPDLLQMRGVSKKRRGEKRWIIFIARIRTPRAGDTKPLRHLTPDDRADLSGLT